MASVKDCTYDVDSTLEKYVCKNSTVKKCKCLKITTPVSKLIQPLENEKVNKMCKKINVGPN